DSIPYGHYRDEWSRLVMRVDKDSPAERWVLLPGLEQDCQLFFKAALEKALSKQGVRDGVQNLVSTYADREYLARKAEKEHIRADSEAAGKRAEQAAKKAKDAKSEEERLTAARDAASARQEQERLEAQTEKAEKAEEKAASKARKEREK